MVGSLICNISKSLKNPLASEQYNCYAILLSDCAEPSEVLVQPEIWCALPRHRFDGWHGAESGPSFAAECRPGERIRRTETRQNF